MLWPDATVHWLKRPYLVALSGYALPDDLRRAAEGWLRGVIGVPAGVASRAITITIELSCGHPRCAWGANCH